MKRKKMSRPAVCNGCREWIPGEGCGILYNIETGRLGKYPGDAVKRGFCSDNDRDKLHSGREQRMTAFGILLGVE